MKMNLNFFVSSFYSTFRLDNTQNISKQEARRKDMSQFQWNCDIFFFVVSCLAGDTQVVRAVEPKNGNVDQHSSSTIMLINISEQL